ncbi:MAG: hypothetical protein ACO1N0_13775 [Fluviicola sp.]
MKEHNEIDSLFESAFDGLTLTPDASVKENIDQAIASKKKRRRFLFVLFPVLFGTVGFAATLYFYQDEASNPLLTHAVSNDRETELQSLQAKNKKQTDTEKHSNIALTPKPTKSLSGNYPSKTRSTEKLPIKSSKAKSPLSSTIPKVAKQPKIKTTFTPGSRLASSDKPISSQREPKRTDLQLEKTPEKPETKTLAMQEEVALSENKSDSVFSTPDSTSQIIAEILKSAGNNLQLAEETKNKGKWSLAALTYWEGEKKRSAGFQNEPFTDNKREIASIHSSTFYGKIEINRKFGRRWELLTGVGFRSSEIIQYGSVDKIEFPIEGLGSVIPISPPVPDTVLSKHVQSFRVNSVVLPLGFGYSIPLKYNMRIRLAAGAEFAYGQFARETLDKNLSAPTLRPFGCSVWIRPELYYSFGRMELFGFGTFNQTLSQQLRWDFEPKRNPAFGGGIGLRIQL